MTDSQEVSPESFPSIQDHVSVSDSHDETAIQFTKMDLLRDQTQNQQSDTLQNAPSQDSVPPDGTIDSGLILSSALSTSTSGRIHDVTILEDIDLSKDDEEAYLDPAAKPTVGEKLKKCWSFIMTVKGFLITIYACNVIAWGGMLFLLLCNAAPAMCHPSCTDINSSRILWIEIDTQILVALLCIPAFGLGPRRFRDVYLLLKYNFRNDALALHRLAVFHGSWFVLGQDKSCELAEYQQYFVALTSDAARPGIDNHHPVPKTQISYPSPDRRRASPTPLWKLCFVVFFMAMNTVFQAILAGCMWGFTRFDRPSWVRPMCIGIAFSSNGMGGFIMFWEGRRIKKKKSLSTDIWRSLEIHGI